VLVAVEASSAWWRWTSCSRSVRSVRSASEVLEARSARSVASSLSSCARAASAVCARGPARRARAAASRSEPPSRSRRLEIGRAVAGGDQPLLEILVLGLERGLRVLGLIELLAGVGELVVACGDVVARDPELLVLGLDRLAQVQELALASVPLAVAAASTSTGHGRARS